MAQAFDFTRLRRLTMIHAVVQIFLLILLAGSAYVFLAKAPSASVLGSIVRVVVIQLALFYPIYKFAGADAEREVASSAPGLTADEQNALRRKRVFSDIVKGAIFIFFVVFALRAPGAAPVQFMILSLFLLSYLCYFQCFNQVAKRLMKQKS